MSETTVEESNDAQKLQRGLSPLQVQLISLGGIIGSSYFLGAGAIVGKIGPSAVIAFMLGGWIVWQVALSMGDLAVKMPREGSFVSYAVELVNRPWAAGVGWSYWLNWCAYIPSEMIAGGLIMHHWVPQVPVIAWAVVFGIIITVANLVQVKNFGRIESALALIKITAIALFTVMGVLIWLGLIGHETDKPAQFLGTTNLTPFFPAGVMATLFSMVMVLVNFQGTEIIALSAAETENPEKAIPAACRNVAIRIIGIFVIPLLILTAIFPAAQASAEDSAFAASLARYGFHWIAGAFSFVVLTAAMSCANSGLYGAVRALYGLGMEKLGPKWVTHLNHQGVPSRATWLTIGVCWCFVPFLALADSSSKFYVWLLALSGFTGAICWISISWCHLRLLRKQNGRVTSILSYAPMAAQIACLVLTAWSVELRSCMVFGIPAFVIPMLVCWFLDRTRTASSK